jgi:hypothetical protein
MYEIYALRSNEETNSRRTRSYWAGGLLMRYNTVQLIFLNLLPGILAILLPLEGIVSGMVFLHHIPSLELFLCFLALVLAIFPYLGTLIYRRIMMRDRITLLSFLTMGFYSLAAPLAIFRSNMFTAIPREAFLGLALAFTFLPGTEYLAEVTQLSNSNWYLATSLITLAVHVGTQVAVILLFCGMFWAMVSSCTLVLVTVSTTASLVHKHLRPREQKWVIECDKLVNPFAMGFMLVVLALFLVNLRSLLAQAVISPDRSPLDFYGNMGLYLVAPTVFLVSATTYLFQEHRGSRFRYLLKVAALFLFIAILYLALFLILYIVHRSREYRLLSLF